MPIIVSEPGFLVFFLLSGSTSDTINPTDSSGEPTYTVSIIVSGLSGNVLVLRNNGTDDLFKVVITTGVNTMLAGQAGTGFF